MTDSHCHLDYCANPHEAADASLAAIITIGTTLERCQSSLELAECYPNVWASVGIHPNNSSDARDPAIREAIEAMVKHPRVVAIGETGFDTYWDDETLDTQRESLLWQLELAKSYDLPLILHVRDKQNHEDASLAAAAMLEQAGYPKGILHCCNAHPRLTEVGLELGWLLSFAGNLTYPKATELHELAGRVPQEQLLLETDSPFLTPIPNRGQRNRPSNVRHTAAFLAELRTEPLAVVEAYTDSNAQRIYGLPVASMLPTEAGFDQ